MIIFHIDYEEGKQETYRGIYLTHEEERVIGFYSGDVEKDFKQALIWCYDRNYGVYFSSDVDHFVQDGIHYGWKIENGVEVIYKLTEEEISYNLRSV